MAGQEYVAAITFADNSATYEALTKLRNNVSNEITAAAIVERDASGRLQIPDGTDFEAGSGTAGGSLIGMLIGVLGGPLGMLIGMTAGAATGALFDADRLDSGDEVIEEFGKLVPPGRNAILAQTNESDPTVLDSVVTGLSGKIVRRPLDEVLAELEAQEAAAEEADRAARKAIRDKKREQRKESFHERVDALKSKFSS